MARALGQKAGFQAEGAETSRTLAQIVETARRDSAVLYPEGIPQSVPEGQGKLKVIDRSAEATAKVEPEAKETDKAHGEILKQLVISATTRPPKPQRGGHLIA